MSLPRIIGAVALVIGLVLLGMAYNASQAPAEQLSEAVTGSFSDQTITFLIAGAAAVVGGILLFLFGRRRM
jgi:LPXTG-motif cell wall-anchored protein